RFPACSFGLKPAWKRSRNCGGRLGIGRDQGRPITSRHQISIEQEERGGKKKRKKPAEKSFCRPARFLVRSHPAPPPTPPRGNPVWVLREFKKPASNSVRERL